MNRHAAQSEVIDIEKVKLMFHGPIVLANGKRIEFDLEKRGPFIEWSEQLPNSNVIIDFYVTPVLISTDVKQTTGGGDNISAVGLSSHLVYS